MEKSPVSRDYDLLLSKVSGCANREEILAVLERHQDWIPLLDERFIEHFRLIPPIDPNQEERVRILQSIIVEKTVSWAISLQPEEASAYIHEHSFLICSQEAYKFLSQILNDLADNDPLYQHISFYFGMIINELTLVLLNNFNLLDFIRYLDNAKDFLQHNELVEYCFNSHRETFPEKVQLIDERLRVIDLLSKKGMKAVVDDLSLLQYNATLHYIDKETDLRQKELFVEQAIDLSRIVDPNKTAEWRGRLGELLFLFPQNEMILRLEKAIKLSEEYLMVLTKGKSDPEGIAVTKNNLGNGYLNRLQGNKDENIEKGIAYLSESLEYFSSGTDAQTRGKVLMNLGNGFSRRLHGELRDNLEKAIDYYNDAFRYINKEEHPVDWAMASHNCAIAYLTRIAGEKSQNIETASDYLNQALSIYNVSSYKDQWINCQLELANAFKIRLRGDKLQNLQRAKQIIVDAQKHIREADNDWLWGMCCNNLGLVELEITKFDQTELPNAIKNLEAGAKVGIDKQVPYEWAMVQFNLGIAYKQRYLLGHSTAIEMSIMCFRQVLEIWTKESVPFDWAAAQFQLGQAYYYHQYRLFGKTYFDVIHALEDAMTVFSPETMPAQSMDCAALLGQVYFEIRQYQKSEAHYEIAHSCLEALRRESKRVQSRKTLALSGVDVYANLVEVCLLNGQIEKAFRYAMNAKSRSLFDRLNNEVSTVEKKIKENDSFAISWNLITDLRNDIDRLVMEMANPRRSYENRLNTKVLPLLGEKRQVLKIALEDVFFKFPDIAATQTVPVIQPEEIQALSAELGDVPLLEYYRHHGGWCLFMVTAKQILHISLTSANAVKIQDLITWLDAYKKDEGNAANSQIVCANLCELYKVLLEPAVTRLYGSREMIIAPFAELHLLPLHLAKTKNDRYLLDDFVVSYIPCLSALVSLKKARQDKPPPANCSAIFAVAYSASNTNQHYLPHVVNEAMDIITYFDPQPVSNYLLEEHARVKKIISDCNQQLYDVIHFGCHTDFSPDQLSDGGLFLADGILSVERIENEIHFRNSPLIVLAACETSQTKIELSDELLGLIQSFLSAGSHGVISSFWPVDDAASKAFFANFYERITNGIDIATALRDTIIFLRQLPEFDEPFFWAPFQFTGLSKAS